MYNSFSVCPHCCLCDTRDEKYQFIPTFEICFGCTNCCSVVSCFREFHQATAVDKTDIVIISHQPERAARRIAMNALRLASESSAVAGATYLSTTNAMVSSNDHPRSVLRIETYSASASSHCPAMA